MKMRLQGKEFDTADLGEIRVEITDVDLVKLSDAALIELRRCFVSNARKCRRGLFNSAKRALRGAIEQLATQLAAETNRRRRCDSGSAASLILVFKSAEAAGYLAAFLGGLAETYVAERAKIAPQSKLERSITDLRNVAFECSNFCRSVAAAIINTKIEVNL